MGKAAGVLALAALCGVLGLQVERELAAPLAPVAAAAPPAAAQGAVAGRPPPPDFAPHPLAAYAAVLARPLFAPTRRPPQESAEAAAASTSLVLVGIVADAEGKSAVILHGRPFKAVRLGEGQSVDGWTVRSIRPDRVVIANGGDTIEMRLRERSTRPAAR